MPATVTDRISGLTTSVAVKAPCVAATTAAITLNGLQTVGGIALAANDRVLVKDQADSTTNGIYLAKSSAWSRALDFDGALDAVPGTLVVVKNSGTDIIYKTVCSNNPVVFGTSAITFALAAFGDASTISFVQSGTGAIARNVRDKLRDVYNVKDFGAVGDGSTSDDTAIIAAITAAPSGSTIMFPAGNYKLTGANGISVATKTSLLFKGESAKITCAANCRGFFLNGSSDIKITGFQFIGSIQTNGYTGNAEQGRIVVQSSTDVEIYGNKWSDTASAAFIQTGSSRVWFHHNNVLNTHGGIQTSSAVYADLSITDNFFLGHIYNIADQGSDDQIALFGTAGGRCIISRNIINKQGPTARNQARGINVNVGGGTDANVIVSDNIVANVVTTTVAQSRAAIEIGGQAALTTLSRVIVRGNIIENCNTPVYVDVYAENVIIDANIIKSSIYLAGTNPNSGYGVICRPANSVSGYQIINNNITVCGQSGIDFTVAKKGVISGNYISACAGAGIGVDTAQDVVITNNLITGSTAAGISINNTPRVAIVGNISVNNTGNGISVGGASVSGVIAANVTNNNTAGNYSNTATALDAYVTGNYGFGSGGYGISSTSQTAKNLAGVATFGAAASVVVTFSVAEADSSYRVSIAGQANETFWVTTKTANGFTLNSSNAGSTAVVEWHILR